MTTPASTAALLRLEVGRLRLSQPLRRFDTVVHLGHLDGVRRTCTVPRADASVLDAGTRAEVVTRLLEEHPAAVDAADDPVSVWLTRAGESCLQDDDLAWLSAAGRALGALGHRLDGFWAVTRTGWLDIRTGEQRTWKRLRL